MCVPVGLFIFLGNILPADHHLIKSATTALSDMQEFREKGEWKLMFEAANGWIQRNILPDTNVLVYLNVYN